MDKPATTDFAIHELIATRWSSRAFSERTVSDDVLRCILEGARWAPSSLNLQPWRFVVTRRGDDAFGGLLNCLTDFNQWWAKAAPVLMLSAAHTRVGREARENPYALHDLGQATAHLALQATALGLRAHQIGGFSRERAREALHIPAEFEPVTAIALGYEGDIDALPEPLRGAESLARARLPQTDFVFQGTWGGAL